MFNQKTYGLLILSGILLLSTVVIQGEAQSESEQGILDLYTQKGGQGVGVDGGTFGLGEAVRLMVQLNISSPTTVEEASKFFMTKVEFRVADPDAS